MSEAKQDTYSYKGWMNSDSFIKRAFGVYGYGLVASFIISAVVMTVLVALAVLMGGAGYLLSR
ncbi:MAG TPA: hypothetical protein PLF71_02125 [bacterium]|nr:MAG: hypothetical protein BWY14_00629 [Parcubacteria group bacterium ADurb.Bin192]HPN14889.1 hypothetical protein [bacterium]